MFMHKHSVLAQEYEVYVLCTYDININFILKW